MTDRLPAEEIVRQLLDVILRSDPDYVESHAGVTQCMDDEWDAAIVAAEDWLEDNTRDGR